MERLPLLFLLGWFLMIESALLLLFSSCSYAKIIEHTFNVQNITIQRLCKMQEINTVNGGFPGPTIYAEEGDTIVVHVFNESPNNITIHWHGVLQLMSCWEDGPAYITQCPIQPGNRYTYKFNVTGQEGTLWWHAHTGYQRATIHGALIIYPRGRRAYPFPKPYKEIPLILGEWWNQNIENLERQMFESGRGHDLPDANTINGYPGDFYSCSSNEGRILNVPLDQNNSSLRLPSSEDTAGFEPGSFNVKVDRGKTYLLRIINAAMNALLFFRIADHNMTVVAIDALYTNPYPTDIIALAPGQTTDVLFTADQPPSRYYMATSVYRTSQGDRLNPIPATGAIVYDGASNSAAPKMPTMPDFHDTPTAHKFYSSLTGLVGGPFWSPVPHPVDESLFITTGLGLVPCEEKEHCIGPLDQRMAGSLNNISFLQPTQLSLLEAYYNNVDGIYTDDFPDRPPRKFDFANEILLLDENFVFTQKATKLRRIKYNSTVEIVLQTTGLVAAENHPMHLHGYNFHVLGQGFGNYDPVRDQKKLNFVNPQIRNTFDVPIKGWAVIRFRANNPGVWLMHCHIEAHLPIGLAVAFIVEDGPTPATKLPPPPQDLPRC